MSPLDLKIKLNKQELGYVDSNEKLVVDNKKHKQEKHVIGWQYVIHHLSA